jgi:Xaa-Pro aminopeptidase
MTPPPPIAHEEFAARRAAAAGRARTAGLDGLLVCARGGGALDRYANVMYLANFYTAFPFIPDSPGHWSARAHAFLVLPVSDAPLLVHDVPDDGRIALAADERRYTPLVTETLIEALRDRGLAAARIGVAGFDAMPAPVLLALQAALPAARLVPADCILARLRMQKSPSEIAQLRHAAQIGSRMIEAMMAAAVPGASHGDVVAAGLAYLVPRGGMLYSSFMASGRGGPNPVLVRANFPTWGSARRLEDGMWLRLGISGVVGGYVFDLSRSRAIGRATPEMVRLFEAAIEVVEAGIAAIRPGATAGAVAEAGLGLQERTGFPMQGVFNALGHGTGLGWDSPWLVRGDATPITSGMVLNVERTIQHEGWLGDYEDMVLVTEAGTERLTNAQVRFW